MVASLLDDDKESPGRMPEPDRGTGITRPSPAAPSRHVRGPPGAFDRSGQYVGDHPRSEGVPVVWRIALPDTGWIDRHDEIAVLRQGAGPC